MQLNQESPTSECIISIDINLHWYEELPAQRETVNWGRPLMMYPVDSSAMPTSSLWTHQAQHIAVALKQLTRRLGPAGDARTIPCWPLRLRAGHGPPLSQHSKRSTSNVLRTKKFRSPWPKATALHYWLVVYLPLWKIWKSIGMLTFPIYGKIKSVPNHQPDYDACT